MLRVTVRFELPADTAKAAARGLERQLNAPMSPFVGYACEAVAAPPDQTDEHGRPQCAVAVSFCPEWVLTALIAKRLAAHPDFAAGARFEGERGGPAWAREPHAMAMQGEPIAFGRPNRATELLLGLPLRGEAASLKSARWLFRAPIQSAPAAEGSEARPDSEWGRWEHSSLGSWSPAPLDRVPEAEAVDNNVALNLAANWAGTKGLTKESRAMLLGIGGPLSAQKVADRLSTALEGGAFGSGDTSQLQSSIAELGRAALEEDGAEPRLEAPAPGRKSRL